MCPLGLSSNAATATFIFCFYIFITQLHVYVSEYVQHKLSRLGYIKYIQSGQHTQRYTLHCIYVSNLPSFLLSFFRSPS